MGSSNTNLRRQAGAPPTIQFDSEVKVLYRGEQVFKEVLLSEGVEPLEVILPDDIKPQLTYDVVVDPSKPRPSWSGNERLAWYTPWQTRHRAAVCSCT